MRQNEESQIEWSNFPLKFSQPCNNTGKQTNKQLKTARKLRTKLGGLYGIDDFLEVGEEKVDSFFFPQDSLSY